MLESLEFRSLYRRGAQITLMTILCSIFLAFSLDIISFRFVMPLVETANTEEATAGASLPLPLTKESSWLYFSMGCMFALSALLEESSLYEQTLLTKNPSAEVHVRPRRSAARRLHFLNAVSNSVIRFR